MPTITLDKIIFRNNDTYIKMYQGSELIAQVDSGGGYDYLTFTALTAGSTVNFNRPDITTCSYSVDNGTTWTNGDNVTVTLTNIGDKVMYKGVTSAAGTSSDSTVVFTMTGGIKASGSLMSMHNGNPNDTSITYNYEFAAFFNNCSALTDITDLKLPATTLTLSCYNRLFKNTGITSVPSGFLPATTIVESSYSRMFYNCTSLTTVPSNLLPATNFQDTNCYNNMFYGCSALTAAPNLPATTLVRGCYSYMFRNCTRLTSIPDLPAKEIIYQCYYYMFAGCTGLTGTVKVPFDSINSSYNNACSYMFSGCSHITGAEVGTNAGYTSVSVFSNMFRNCSILSSIKCLANYSSNISYSNWVTGVASSGTFIKATGQGWNTGNSGIPTSWTVTEQSPVVPVPEVKGYVTLTNNGNTNSSISVSSYSSVSDGRLVYSTDGTTWDWLTNTAVTLASGSSMYLAGDKISSGSNNNLSITNGSVSISGNVRYLYECSSETPGTMPGSALTYRFKNCTGLVDASGLIMPSTTSYSCYSYMFYGCTSLTSVPSLPATTLTGNCYYSMFEGCTSLTTAPQLPATTLNGNCYYGMFKGCTSLTTAPSLPATTLAVSCYQEMFQGCTGITTVPRNLLPATTLSSNCYRSMFQGCTSLTTAPEIYAEHSSSSSATQPMSNMFNGCSSLNSITTHTTTWDTNLTPDWVLGVAATGDFYNLGEATIATGVSGIPSGWTEHIIFIPVGYITLTNNGNTNTSVSVSDYNSNQYGRLVYSTDGTTWDWLTNTAVTIEPNNNLYIAGDKACSTSSTVSYNKLSITGGSVSVSGNVRYLYEGTSSTPGTMPNYALVKRFSGCTSIADISGLIFPNETTRYCYYEMFSGCTSLTTIISRLPATTLLDYCYGSMFKGCTGLTTAPELPATRVEYGAYNSMFSGCTSLNSRVILPITSVGSYGMQYMFQNCSSFNYLDISSYNESSSNQRFNNMLSGVNSTGDLYIGMKAKADISQTSVPSGWTKHYSGNDWPCVVISAIDNTQPATIRISGQYNPYGYNYSRVFYSTEGADEEKTEVTLSSSSYTNIVIPANKKLYIYGSIIAYTGSYTKANQANFSGTDLVRIESGTLKRLTSYSESGSSSYISNAGYLFADWTGLVSVPADFLPYTSLKNWGGYGVYKGLFQNCTNLTTLPNLPATDLGYESNTSSKSCYAEMFSGCTSITSIPSNYLPATTLSSYVYQSMFEGCTGLTSVPSNLLPATTLSTYCYQSMFKGCTGLATYPELPSTTLAQSCYNGMFYGCTSLTTAPQLPATTLVSGCYSNMFYGCSSLNSITTYATTWDTNYTSSWVDGVAATGDFYSLGNIGTNIPSGADGVPSGWTIHTELPPTPSTPVPTSVSIFNQYNDGTTPSTNYGTLTENTNDYTYTYSGSSYSDRWTGVDIMLPYDCSSFTYHIVASIPGGATSGVNVVAPNANGTATNQMSSGSTSFDSDITVTRPSSATQGNDWRLRTYLKRDGSQSDLTPITITIPKSTI